MTLYPFRVLVKKSPRSRIQAWTRYAASPDAALASAQLVVVDEFGPRGVVVEVLPEYDPRLTGEPRHAAVRS